MQRVLFPINRKLVRRMRCRCLFEDGPELWSRTLASAMCEVEDCIYLVSKPIAFDGSALDASPGRSRTFLDTVLLCTTFALGLGDSLDTLIEVVLRLVAFR